MTWGWEGRILRRKLLGMTSLKGRIMTRAAGHKTLPYGGGDRISQSLRSFEMTCKLGDGNPLNPPCQGDKHLLSPRADILQT